MNTLVHLVQRSLEVLLSRGFRRGLLPLFLLGAVLASPAAAQTRGIVLSPSSLELSERGTASYSVRLATLPSATVTVTITLPQGTVLTLNRSSLMFTTSNWSVPQTVTVTAGSIHQGEWGRETLMHSAAGGNYNQVTASFQVSIYNIDHSLTVRVQGGNEVLEGGSTEHNVSLSGPVPASTTVDVTGWEGTDVTVDNAALIFTTSNWSEPQTVTITADEDDDASNDRLSLKYQSRIGAQEYGNITLSMTVRDDEELAVAIGGVPAKINSTTALSVRFTFSEAVTGFETGDVNISGGTRGAFAGSGTTYTLAVTPTSGSNVTVEVAANSATLGGGNTGPSSAVSAMATWDAAAPTVSINDVPAKINSKAPFTAEFEFSEAVTGFVIGDVTVTGGTRGAFAGSGTTYTLAVTPTGGADVVVTVAADAATDGLNTGPASEVSATATWDAAAPTVSINDVPAKINSKTPFTAEFEFSEAVTGFVIGDVTVTGGTRGAFAGSGTTYTLAVTPTGGADVVVTVAADAATDGLNTGPASEVSVTATWDVAAPTVSINDVPAKINSKAPFTAEFEFSEAVTGFVIGDVTVTGGTRGAFAGSGTNYTLAVTPTGGADVVVTVAADAATDGLNTGPASEVSATATWDAAAPTVSINDVPAKINSKAPFTAEFEFSEAVTGFVIGDVTVTGGTRGAFAGSGTTYTLAVTPTGGADVVVTVAADAATDGLNTGPASEVSALATWDAAAPTVSINDVPAKINSKAPFTAEFEFSEAVTGFVIGDVTVTGGTRGAFAGSGTTYTLAVTPIGGADVTVEVAANSVTDGLNTGPALAVSATATWDATVLTVTIQGVPAKINSTTAFNAEFVFSEAVTGFDDDDITIAGGTEGAFAGSGTTYTLAVTPTGSANVVVTVAADAATDGLNTGPASAVSKMATWDVAAPTLEINDVPPKINSTTAFTAEFVFSEAVTGFTATDITVTGGTTGAFAGSGRTYTLAVTPTSGSNVTVEAAANAATDGLNTGPASAVSKMATWDVAAPTLEINDVPPKINSTTAFTAEFVFSEAVTGFTATDITVTGGTTGAFAGSGRTYTLAVTPTSGSNVTVEAAANAATDGLNTGPASAVSKMATWDVAAPTLEINDVPPKINSTTAFTAEFVFSEAVTGFTATDITVTGGTTGAFAGSGRAYTLAVTPTSGSNVTVEAAANAATDGLNTGPASAVSRTATWDAAAPTVTIGLSDKINSTAALSVTFTFSEDVTGFAATDITVTGGTAGAFAGSGRTYTLAVTPTSGSNVTVEVAANAATDGLNTGPASAVSATATWDATALTVAIGGVPAKINSAAAFSVTFTFSEDVTDFVTGDVTVTGATRGAFAGSGASYTLVVTPTGSANVVVTVAADAATDGLNTGPASAVTATVIWDATAPTVEISGVPAKINTTAALSVTFTYSEEVTGFAATDITITGGTAGIFAGSGRNYSLMVTPTNGSNVTVTVAADAATDDLNLGPTSVAISTAIWDDTAPTVTIAGVPDRINSTTALTATFTFSEDVTGFVTGDVNVTGGTKGAFSGSGTSYTLLVTPTGGSNVTVTVTAEAATDGLNTGPASAVSATATWDATALTVTIGGVPAKINSVAALSVTFTFSEDVTGFVTGDVNVTGGTKGAFTGTGTTYMLVVTPTGGSNVTVTVAAEAATDGLNTGPASAVSATATWDATALTVTIGGVPAKINSVAALNVTFTFSEDVTGFVTGDVNVTGGTKGAFAGAGTTYMLVVTPTGGSNVTVTVAADAATDGISTGPTSAVAATAIWDDTAPTVTIGGLPAEINTVAALTATFTFSEAVTGFVTGDVNVTGGTKGAFTGTGTTYMLVVTPTGGSKVTVTVAAAAATDGLNTGPASAVSATATWEAIVPSVSFASLVSSAGEDAGTRNVTVNLSPIPTAAITVNYTVSGTAMVGSDFSISGLGTLPVASGATMAAIRVEITDDMVDENDETVVLTFTTGPGYTVGSRNSHTLTITDDDDAIPMVSLSAAPNPVDEGDSVKVMARLSEAISQSVTVPLVLMAGTAEPEDYGSLASIIIPGGQTTGTGMVTTAQDSDRDDETFTVALGPLPEGLVEGSPSSVKVTIDDLTAPPNRSPTVSASCAPCVVRPGGQVDLAAMASDPDGDPLVYHWSAAKGSFAGTADQAVAVWMAPVEIGKIEIRVEVSDGRGGRESAAVEVEVVNSAPAFEQSPYIFMLPEGVDGRERPADLDRVAALDPDGDELTYEILSGDRQRFTVGARDGMVRYVGAGEDFETEPNQFALVVRASDGFRGEAKVEVAIKVTDLNEAPGAVDDEAVTPEDQVVTVDVLANDSDPDGDRLQVRSVTEAANGAVRLVSGDRVTYTPEADFHGADSFTYVASDGRGLTDTARVTVMVLPINDAPQAIGRIADQTLDEGGDPVQVELSPYFGDRDGDALTYSARSGDTGVVVAAVAVAVLTLTPVVYGSAMVTITATDPAGLTATQSVRVGVSDRPQRAILENVLAATARGHLASLRAALGRRMQANPCEASPLEGMGRAESLGRTEAGSMLKGLGARAGSAMGAVLHVGEEALDPFGALQAQRRVPTKSGANAALETTDLMEAALRSVPGRALGIKGRAEFLIGWGGPQYDGWRCPGHGRWSLWGQGDIQEFKGIPSVDSDYDGDLSTGYAGLDMRLGARWLAGVAVSRSKGIGNWRTGTSEGRYTQLMTAVHPYLRWDGPSTSILASAGEGKGNARNARAAGSTGTSPTNLRLGLVELKQRLNVPGQLDFAFLGDAAWAWLRTGDGEETIDGQDIAVNQVRIGLDLSLPARFGSLELTPSGTVHARRDGGAGQTGSGIEVAGRLRAARGIVRLDAQVRMLAHHTAEGYRERGAAVTFALGRQGGEEGFSLSVSPRWGGSARSSGALLHGPLGDGFRDRGSNLEHWTLDALAGYGFILPGGLKLDLQGGYGGAIDGLGLQLRVAAANDEMARRLLRPH